MAVIDKNNTAVIGCGGDYFAYSSFCAIMGREGIPKLDFVFVPSNEKHVYSFFDDIVSGYDTDVVKNCEYGTVKLGEIEADCERDFAFINCRGVTALILFDYDININSLPEEYLKADYLLTRYALPKGFDENNFGQAIVLIEENPEKYIKGVRYAGNEILYLEVEQNGRARLKTANQR